MNLVGKFLLVISFGTFLNLHAQETSACDYNIDSAQARKFMVDQDMINEGDEDWLPELGMGVRWTISQTTYNEEKALCVIAMGTCMVDEQHSPIEGSCDPTSVSSTAGALDVILAKKENGHIIFGKFSEYFDVPNSIKAAFVNDSGGPGFHYYAEVTGKSALEVMKSKHGKIKQYSGFSGVIVKGVKSSFDPVVERGWYVADAKFSLRRGTSPEVEDVYPRDFDQDFSGMYVGCERKTASNGKEGCQATPWNAGLHKILSIN